MGFMAVEECWDRGWMESVCWVWEGFVQVWNFGVGNRYRSCCFGFRSRAGPDDVGAGGHRAGGRLHYAVLFEKALVYPLGRGSLGLSSPELASIEPVL